MKHIIEYHISKCSEQFWLNIFCPQIFSSVELCVTKHFSATLLLFKPYLLSSEYVWSTKLRNSQVHMLSHLLITKYFHVLTCFFKANFHKSNMDNASQQDYENNNSLYSNHSIPMQLYKHLHHTFMNTTGYYPRELEKLSFLLVIKYLITSFQNHFCDTCINITACVQQMQIHSKLVKP